MNRLQMALEAKGISQRACAKFLGVSEKTISNKILGITDFSYGEAMDLKALLPEYDIEYLLRQGGHTDTQRRGSEEDGDGKREGV